ncbi:hypothetical protein AK812_SmicGene14030 [Symbiodinium microadriaticum]|uniref:Uncharacterized protein n=1 Tax=Symbiodinium microadriaticum TaxID=2951 RepID=A0A1Q9E6L0_SYMMI|nr:hypothetical protein AK812_SmicGene14030 [Symbiodinium microadriaticum]CAE7874382.1 unnamed protein product [Symbiodinium microadriaticum]CAE7899945.1 unnamed protein product [Symbiodinium sp. KB8]
MRWGWPYTARHLSCLSLLASQLWLRDAGAMVAQPDLHNWIPHMRPRTLHTGDLQQLMQKYRVVVLMTSIPRRIDHMEPVIDAMLAQSWQAAEIYMSIPYIYNRTGETYHIPEWMQAKVDATPTLHLVHCVDLGPGTHLLNGLRMEKDPWTFLVVVDDDHIYGPELVEQLMRAALGNPGSAVAAQGFLSVPGLLESQELHTMEEQGGDRPRYLQDQGFAAGPVLVSYLGVVYQRGFFDDTVYFYNSDCQQCRYQDDMWFSAHLAQKGIRRLVLGAALGVQELTEFHLGPESLTFWEENKPRQISDDCNKGLLRANSHIWALRRRVVLALGGLPPAVWPIPDQVPKEWAPPLAAISRLRQLPDLTYLCTSGWNEASHSSGFLLGTSFMFGNILATGSSACAAHSEARISQLMQDALLWEGDPNTVVVMGSLPVLEEDPTGFWEVAECAASMFDATAEDAEAEEKRLRDLKEQAAEGSMPQQYGHLVLNFLFRQRGSPLQGLGDVALPRSQKRGEQVWPYCRIGDWVAATVGAFSRGYAGYA